MSGIGTAPVVQEATALAMGSRAQVVVVGGRPGLADGALQRIEYLESLWSRFRPGSDISRANAGAGRPVTVSPPTIGLVRRAIAGWRRTGGRFDPTVLAALEALGYDRSFEQITSSPARAASPGSSPGCGGIVTDAAHSTLLIPAGCRFDAGGIGKGLAADLVAAELLGDGAAGVCVNLGGDLKVVGEAPRGGAWPVGLEDPYDLTREQAHFAVADAGVATTSRTYRTWERAGRQVHHVIDPATGAPAWTDLASVTVVAAAAWWAEVLAKAAFVAGPAAGAALIARAGATGVMVDDGGFSHPLPGFPGEVGGPCT